MNAVIYARYSSHSQQETSIEGQLKVCYEYCEKQGYTVVNEYIDRAMSGRDDNRPSFLRMISDSSKKGFQYVVVYQFDRFSRNRFSSAKYKELLKSNGVRVLSAKETVSDQPDGILVEGFFECMAEYYSAELSQKVKRGMDINAEKCLSTGGNIALGYKIDREKRFQIDNDKAPIVKKVFEMYADGISISEIVDYLNRLGYTTAKGKEFKKNSLQTMLRNKRYTGVYTYKGTEIPDGIPRIISDELFEKVAKRLAKNKQAPARSKAKEDYLLTTKLFCGYCKEMMTGISGKGHLGSVYRYYTCNGKRKHGCNKKSVRKEHIENIVVEQCKKLLTDRNIKKIAKAVSELCASQQESYHLQDLKSQLSKAIRKHDNLLEVLSECEDKEIRQSVLGKLSQVNEQIKSLNSEILKEEKSINIVSEDDILFFLLSLKNNRNNDEKYRKTLINIFVNAVYLYDDKLTIIFNSGDKPVTVNDLLLEEIQENLESSEGLCFNSVGPPDNKKHPRQRVLFIFKINTGTRTLRG